MGAEHSASVQEVRLAIWYESDPRNQVRATRLCAEDSGSTNPRGGRRSLRDRRLLPLVLQDGTQVVVGCDFWGKRIARDELCAFLRACLVAATRRGRGATDLLDRHAQFVQKQIASDLDDESRVLFVDVAFAELQYARRFARALRASAAGAQGQQRASTTAFTFAQQTFACYNNIATADLVLQDAQALERDECRRRERGSGTRSVLGQLAQDASDALLRARRS